MLKSIYVKFWSWMRSSGTIAFARLQVLIGIVLTVLSTTDVTPIFKDHPQWLVWWTIASGVIAEYVRRRGTEVVSVPTYVPESGTTVDVLKLKSTDPDLKR